MCLYIVTLSETACYVLCMLVHVCKIYYCKTLVAEKWERSFWQSLTWFVLHSLLQTCSLHHCLVQQPLILDIGVTELILQKCETNYIKKKKKKQLSLSHCVILFSCFLALVRYQIRLCTMITLETLCLRLKYIYLDVCWR